MKAFAAFFLVAECSKVVEPVFWRVDNERFANDYTRDVQLQTKMDIYCPQYESAADEDVRTFSKSHHFQTIYLVDESSYKNCNLDMRKAKKIMSCEQPLRVKKYTMKFQEVNPNPYGLEFHADTAYYFISTSLGEDLTGLTQMQDGVCRTHGMKLKIQVRRGDADGIRRISDEGAEDEKIRFPEYFAYDGRDSTAVSRPDEISEDPEKWETNEGLPNAVIVGVIVGIFLVILIIVAILLTRRVFENRKSSVSYPTLSDYQSSYVEKYEYPPVSFQTASPQSVYQTNYAPTNIVQPNIVSLVPKGVNYAPGVQSQEKRINDDFSYIDASRLSNRHGEIVMV